MKSTPRIPTRAELDAANEGDVENPRNLCANWRMGCNAVTDGPIGDRLTLCDDCHEAELAEHGIK
jgi:hypothetical protein